MFIPEFSVFLDKTCHRIPHKKLKSRIRRELREHMDDMLEDFLGAGEERKAAIENVIKEMGDPVKLNKELRYAHRKEIFLAVCIKTLSAILIIALLFSIPIFGDVASSYIAADTKEELIQSMEQKGFYHYGEIERNGRVYLIFAKVTPEENRIEYYESIRFFGKYNITDRFGGWHGVVYGDENENLLLRLRSSESLVYFSFKPVKTKYFQVGFFNKYEAGNENKPYEITSDFYAVPNVGEYLVIDAPQGYRFSGFYYLYDENKQKIEEYGSGIFASCEGYGGGSSSNYTGFIKAHKIYS